jgi:O-antigen ligase
MLDNRYLNAFKTWIPRSTLVLLAITLQIQVTLFASETYTGIRVNAADFLLPLLGLGILTSLLLKKSNWPIWQKPFGYWALFIMSFIIIASLLNGYRISGEFTSWALFNKAAGWFVLMAYIAAAAWFNINKPQLVHNWFIIPLAGFLCGTIILESVFRILNPDEASMLFKGLGSVTHQDLSGLMANRNAFAFLYLSILTLGTYYLSSVKDLIKTERYFFYTLWFLLPVFLALNLSRSSLLILVPLILFLLITNRVLFFKKLLPLILIGALLVPLTSINRIAFVLGNVNKNISYAQNSLDEASLIEEDTLYRGDSHRIQIIKDCWALIQKHPITGAGLGSVIKYQEDQGRSFITVIDNTALWILTEMGPAGLIVFLSAFITILIALYKQRNDNHLATAMLLILFGFGFYSLFHEILYSRFLWFLLGLSLSIPIIKDQNN